MTAVYPGDEQERGAPPAVPSREPRTADPYPVLAEQALGRPGRRRWRYWRDPETLPAVPPGAVLVFRMESDAEVFENTHLSGYEEAVLDATSVSVVQMRPRSVPAEVLLTTRNQALDIAVQVTFTVQVVDAVAIAAQGLTDLPALLTHLLHQDAKLVSFQDRFDADDIVAARRAVTAFALATYAQSPPQIRGLRLSHPRVEVTTPDAVRTHAATLQDETWADTREQRRIDRNAGLMRTPEQMDAVAVTRGELSMADAARAQRERDDAQFERIRVEVEALMRSGAADRVPVDLQRLVGTFYERLSGQPPTAQLPPSESIGQHAVSVESGEPPVPNEDDDDGAHG
jgi:hypothetical protein